MKSTSIRLKILTGVVLVNLVGMITIMVYLHQSYSGGLDVTAQKSATQGVAAWGRLTVLAKNEYGPVTQPASATKYLDDLREITGSEYGLLLDKSSLDEATYVAQREKLGLANNWDERDNYVLTAVTNDDVADQMQLSATPDTIPEIGRVVGVENGACSKTCHGAVKGQGDFWMVSWSTDAASRAHTVFPVTDDSGKPIGVVYSIEDISAQANNARDSLLSTTAVTVGGLLAGTIVIALMLSALVFRRLDRMIESIQDISVRVAGGDFDAHFEPDGSTDEIGRFEEFFAKFMGLISSTLKSLSK